MEIQELTTISGLVINKIAKLNSIIGNLIQKNISNKVRRPTAIKILSALCIIAGLILIAILVIEKFTVTNVSLNLFSAVTIFILGIVSALLGYGILRGGKWIFILICVLITTLILEQLAQIGVGDLSGIYGVVVGFIVLYSITRKDVKRLFGFRTY